MVEFTCCFRIVWGFLCFFGDKEAIKWGFVANEYKKKSGLVGLCLRTVADCSDDGVGVWTR